MRGSEPIDEAPDRYSRIDFEPPQSVADAASKGLRYRAKASPSNRGGLTPAEASKLGIGSGVQRAVNLKNRDNASPGVIRQMAAFFSRHEKNKSIAPENRETPWNDKGHVAWLLWGGDPGRAWADRIRDQMNVADEKAAPMRSSESITEAVVNIPDGMRINDWLRALAAQAVEAVSALLPPAPANTAGRYPDTWVRMVDASPSGVLVCVSYWAGSEVSFRNHYRVPFSTTADGEIQLSPPVETEVMYEPRYTDPPPSEDSDADADYRPSDSVELAGVYEALAERSLGAVAEGEALLARLTGSSPLAPGLAVALSAAKR